MFVSIQNDLNTIVQEINHIMPQARVFLFGSYATGTQREDSDIDLCVVVPQLYDRPMEMIYTIRTAITDKTKLPIDILLFTNDEFERKSKMKPTIQYAIAKKGVLLNG